MNVKKYKLFLGSMFFVVFGIIITGCGNGGTPGSSVVSLVNHKGAFEFGVAPQDWWGPVCGLPGCVGLENNKNEVPQLMTGVARAGGSLLIINDFYKAMTGFGIGPHTGTGADTVTQLELNNLVTKARAVGQNNLILNPYLYTSDPVIDAKFKGLWTTTNVADVKKYLTNWKTMMVAEAKRATISGVDGLVIVPGNYFLGLTGVKYFDIKTELQSLVNAVKINYNGKIYLQGEITTLIGIANVVTGIDSFILEHRIESIFSNILPADSNNINVLKSKWNTYLTNGIWNTNINNLYAKGDVYIGVLMPSYRGALQSGWVEPAASYPAGSYAVDEKLQANIYEALFQTINALASLPMKGVITYGFWWSDNMYPTVWQRNDIAHSIRNKQAEVIFTNWSNIIK